MNKPFVVTTGEPAGIGPDISLSIANRDDASDFVVFGNISLLEERARVLDLKLSFIEYTPRSQAIALKKNQLLVQDFSLTKEVQCSNLNEANSPYVLEMINQATKGCLNGNFSGFITCPVSKEVIANSGFNFKGHTEYIGNLCKASPVMSFISNDMKLALATTHVSLQEVPSLITQDLLMNICDVISFNLNQYFGISEPRIAILGLNPHAGENGLLGSEEIQTIIPAIETMRNKGLNIFGPYAADTALLQNNDADIIISLFHDQILPLFKYSYPHLAANVTLGLGIIRTSVDHGVDLEQAGRKNTNNQSLNFAMDIAKKMSACYANSKNN
jgi:4-hydroxythreonine-4-phosphate dehydrogenase